MTDATDLMPPCDGSRSNPILFGIAEGLSALYPVAEPSHALADASSDVGRDARDDERERPQAA